MAWTKIPKENHPLFLEVIPDNPKIRTIKMFGGMCATVNGNMFAGLWDESMMVRLDEANMEKALAMKGSKRFDPMGKGRPMKDMVVLPSTVMSTRAELKGWIGVAIDHTETLPPKKKKAAKKKAAKKKAAKKKVAKKKVVKKKVVKKKVVKKKVAKKKVAKKKVAQKK